MIARQYFKQVPIHGNLASRYCFFNGGTKALAFFLKQISTLNLKSTFHHKKSLDSLFLPADFIAAHKHILNKNRYIVESERFAFAFDSLFRILRKFLIQ